VGDDHGAQVLMRRVGRCAVLVEVDDPTAVQAWHAELRSRRDAGDIAAVEIVPGARTVLLDGVPDASALIRALRTWPTPAPPALDDDATVTVPTRYDGPDLADVARRWGVTTDEAVALHSTIEYRVAFCGFAPGFAYLTGLPAHLQVPRLDAPRVAVPAGSVAIAGPYCAIYPGASPGGWRLLGRTDLVLFDLTAEPAARLAPGTRVTFTPAPRP
jgi:KipI family sensor histidine kinase inhibitor